MSKDITVNVLCYDPKVDDAPELKTYEVPWIDDEAQTGVMSLLQCFHWINENVESFAYDYNCGNGLCGRCGVMVNGAAHLACWTKVDAGQTYTVEPLKGLPVVRDLVVDKRNTYNKYVATDISLQRRERLTEMVDMDFNLYWNTLDKMNQCRECMCCYAACPLTNGEGSPSDKFIGPGALVQIAARHIDPRDEADRVWQGAFSGAYECDLCGKCSTVCPAGIDIVGAIRQLQEDGKAKGLGTQITNVNQSIAQAGEALLAASQSTKGSAKGTTAQEIIEANCSTSGCHDAEKVLSWKGDADQAAVRVDGHASSSASLSDEQKEVLKAYFTK